MPASFKLPAAIVVSTLLILGSLLVVFGANGTSPFSWFVPKHSIMVLEKEQGPSQITAEQASAAVKNFVAEATSDTIAQAFPDKATSTTFAKAIDMVDEDADSEQVVSVLSDFAMLKITKPKSKITVEVDQAKVIIIGDQATAPPGAVTVKIDGVTAANSKELAKQIGRLKFSEGKWSITFSESVTTPATAPDK